MKTWLRPSKMLLTLVAGVSLSAVAGPLQLVSTVNSNQVPAGGGGGDSFSPLLSRDGRYVLFASTANNLVTNISGAAFPEGVTPCLNVFLRDRANGITRLVSMNASGNGGGNNDSVPVALSTNGQLVLFESRASNLVAGDTNNATDVFVRDLVRGTTTLLSVSTNGGCGNGASRNATMTPDGRYVAFVSAANNLVAGDTNGIADVFVRDLQAGVTMLASVGAAPTNGAVALSTSEGPDLSDDGRYVAFYSTASNLVAGVSTVGDVYVRDLVAGTTAWVSSEARTFLPSNSVVAFNHALSADGRFVVYEASGQFATFGMLFRYRVDSGLTELVHTNAAVVTGNYEDIHNLDITPDGRFIAFVANTNDVSGTNTCVEVWDGQSGTLTLASGDVNGTVPAGSTCDWPRVTPDGQRVAFLSSAPNLVSGGPTAGFHLYMRDLAAATTTLVDVDGSGAGAPLSSTIPRLSADGQLVAFECPDANLVANDNNGAEDVFLRNLSTGTTELVSARDASLPSWSPNGLNTMMALSSDGRYVVFSSGANNLVANDTNGLPDVFVRDTLLGTNVLVSVSTNGGSADGVSREAVMSLDGRYVAFTSMADNLAAGDSNNRPDVYLRDLQAGTTVLVSVNTNGTSAGNGTSYSPLRVSSDGRYVYFISLATDLAPGNYKLAYNLFVRDLQAGTTYALSTNGVATSWPYPLPAITPDGRFAAYYAAFPTPSPRLYVWDAQAASCIYTNTIAFVDGLAISADGKCLAYVYDSGAYYQPVTLYGVDLAAKTNWVVDSGSSGTMLWQQLRLSADGRLLAGVKRTGTTNQVYLYDMQAKTNVLLSQEFNSLNGAVGNSDSPDISADGRFVAYRSAATNIVPGDSNGVPDIFLYDCITRTTTLLSASLVGNVSANNRSLNPRFSSDGQRLFFQSWASDLADADFNHQSDLFAYQLYATAPLPLFSASILPAGPGQAPWITWPVVPGRNYRVQFKNSLTDATWQDLNGHLGTVGNQGYCQELAPAAGPRFYRVVAF